MDTERTVVLGFVGLVAGFVGLNVLVYCGSKRHTAPYSPALEAAKKHQVAILAAGVLDSIRNLPEDADRIRRLTGAIDRNARDVRGAPLTPERVQIIDEYVAFDLRSAGRDGITGNTDDVVVLVSFALANGQWHSVHRAVVEQHGQRFDFDLRTGRSLSEER